MTIMKLFTSVLEIDIIYEFTKVITSRLNHSQFALHLVVLSTVYICECGAHDALLACYAVPKITFNYIILCVLDLRQCEYGDHICATWNKEVI